MRSSKSKKASRSTTSTRPVSVDAPRLGRLQARWFVAPPLALSLLSLLFILLPQLIGPAWWLWVWLLEGPHLLATWMRTYADETERRVRAKLLGASLLF